MPKIFFEGRDYDNPEQMTPEARARYEKAVQMLPDRDSNGIPDLLEGDGVAIKPAASSAEPAAVPAVSPAAARKAALAVKKNRRWILLVVIAIISVCVACFGIIFFGIYSLLRSSGAYQMALEKTQNDPTAQQVLGVPIQEGIFTTGSVSESGSSGTADLEIPVHGPAQTGTLYVSAIKEEDTWRLSSLILEAGGQQYQLVP